MRWIMFVLGLSSWCLSLAVNAQPPLTVEEELAWAIARTAVNEASLARIQPADIALIWQVVRHRADTNEERLEILSRHSRCVLGSQPLNERQIRYTNCVWSRNLSWRGSEPPSGWPANLIWAPENPRFFHYQRRWATVRRSALELVQGRSRIRPPCTETPFTWGGARDHDRATRRGCMRRLICNDTWNSGYALVPRCEAPSTGDGPS